MRINFTNRLMTWVTVGLMLVGAQIWMTPAVAATSSDPVAVQEFKPDSFAQLLRSQSAQPFILILWSLDCEFCQASLATLAQKKRQYPHLRIVTLATDQLADPQTAALIKSKLKKLSLTQHAWAFGSAPPEQLRYAIDPQWRGEMPRSYWFDGHGGVRVQSGVITAEVVAQFIGRR